MSIGNNTEKCTVAWKCKSQNQRTNILKITIEKAKQIIIKAMLNFYESKQKFQKIYILWDFNDIHFMPNHFWLKRCHYPISDVCTNP